LTDRGFISSNLLQRLFLKVPRKTTMTIR